MSDWQVSPDSPTPSFPLAMSHANIIIKCRSFSVTAWEAFIKRASEITVVIHPAKITLIKNVLNPRALWRVIISVPPLFFHTLSDRDVDFINAPREWDSFAQDVSCIIGEDSRKIWAGDGSSKPQALGCWKKTGSWQGVQINISPISEVIVTEPSNVCIRTVLHECILTICTSHASLSETRANQCLCKELLSNLGLAIRRIQKKEEKKKGEKTKTKSQISHWSKASSINKSQQIDVALLQDFSVWVCKAALFAIPLCCWKNTPWKQDSWYGMVFQCIVTIFLSDSCLAGCPKLTFWIQCEKLYLLWM